MASPLVQACVEFRLQGERLEIFAIFHGAATVLLKGSVFYNGVRRPKHGGYRAAHASHQSLACMEMSYVMPMAHIHAATICHSSPQCLLPTKWRTRTLMALPIC